MNQNNLQNNKGFTIIELVISIFVLSIAVVGAYNAFTTMDILTSSSTNRFTAAYLAQEGIEIVRNIRDTNWIKGYDWRCGLADVTGTTMVCETGNKDCTTGCEADYTTFGTADSPLYPWGGSGNYLSVDSNGFYVYDYNSTDENLIATKFKRKITVIPTITYTNESGYQVFDTLRVIVEVSWDEKANILHPNTTQDSIIAEEYLYNWY